MSFSRTTMLGVSALAVLMSATFGSTAFAQSAPTLSEQQLTANNMPSFTNDYMVKVNGGFDFNHNLQTNVLETYDEANMVRQIDTDCANDIKRRVNGMGWVKLRTVVKTSGLEALGELLGYFFAIPHLPILIAKEVGFGTAGAAAGGAAASVDEAIKAELGNAHYACVLQMVEHNPDQLRRILIIGIPRLSAKLPGVLSPNAVQPAAYATPAGPPPAHSVVDKVIEQ